MKKKLIILGASGNIGTQVLDTLEQHQNEFEIVGMSVGDRAGVLEEYLETHTLQYACLKHYDDYERISVKYPDTQFFYGDEGLQKIASIKCNLVINALQGFVGAFPTLKAIEAGNNIAIANKESLVGAGQIIMDAARKHNVKIIPIDSEHSAIFQCLQGNDKKNVRRIIITASGGSFRRYSRKDLEYVTLEEALKHPSWKMSPKITIDSATMMNKGFEVIEAHVLFDLPYDKIETIMHWESVVHSFVEYNDHSLMAQMGVSDMRIPIQYSLTYPERLPNRSEPLDLEKLGSLHFEKLDYERFPLMKLAYSCGKKGGNMPAVLNGANEKAVEMFLMGKCKFLDIERLIFRAVEAAEFIPEPTLEQIIESDSWAQNFVRKSLGGKA